MKKSILVAAMLGLFAAASFAQAPAAPSEPAKVTAPAKHKHGHKHHKAMHKAKAAAAAPAASK